MLSKKQIPSSFDLPDGKLLLAFSGGSDSLCLLYLLSLVAKDRSEAVYINHKVREEEEIQKEIALNRENAAKLSIPFTVIELEKGEIGSLEKEKDVGIEGALRELRYKALERYRSENGFDFILTAHHEADQAETLLMRMLQGSPFYTYRGILKEDGHIYRPLLGVSKQEILKVLALSGLAWAEDSTNSDTRYLRNNIRHRLMPTLSEDARKHLIAIARNVAEIRKDSVFLSFDNPYFNFIGKSEYAPLSQFEKEACLYSLLSRLGVKGRIKRTLIDELDRRIEKGVGRFSSMGVDFFFSKEGMRAYKAIMDFAEPFSISGNAGPFAVINEPLDEKDLRIDLSLLKGTPIMRTSREGDRIELKAGTRRISEIERELHVPYSLLLEDEEGIVAMFSRHLGGKDRLSKRFLDKAGEVVRVCFREAK